MRPFEDKNPFLSVHGLGEPKPYERNPGKMTFITASGLLPAGIAVYVQREPNGVLLETRYPVGL